MSVLGKAPTSRVEVCAQPFGFYAGYPPTQSCGVTRHVGGRQVQRGPPGAQPVCPEHAQWRAIADDLTPLCQDHRGSRLGGAGKVSVPIATPEKRRWTSEVVAASVTQVI